MTRSARTLASQLARRAVLCGALGTLIQGCAPALPHLRPGSNVSLPRPQGNAIVDLLLGGCEAPTGSSRTPARDVVDCVPKDPVERAGPTSQPANSPAVP